MSYQTISVILFVWEKGKQNLFEICIKYLFFFVGEEEMHFPCKSWYFVCIIWFNDWNILDVFFWMVCGNGKIFVVGKGRETLFRTYLKCWIFVVRKDYSENELFGKLHFPVNCDIIIWFTDWNILIFGIWLSNCCLLAILLFLNAIKSLSVTSLG